MLAIVLATVGSGGPCRLGGAGRLLCRTRRWSTTTAGRPGRSAYFKRLLANLRNHVEAVGKAHVEIRVVSLGDGVGLFQSGRERQELAGRIDALKGMGVRFLSAPTPLRERKIDRSTLYGVGEDDLVPSGVAELARLQGMGFAYIHP